MIDLKTHKIGKTEKPFIIAEMSGNHNQSLDRALSIVDAAADAGANAIKLQTYTADTMTLDIKEREFFIDDPESLWKGQAMHDLYKLAHTPWEWHKPIMEHAKSKNLLCFSSPFDESAVDFLETLNVPLYKIASFECIDLPLIKKVASTKKPLIISTGMASINEITEAVDTARTEGCKDLILLKCTSTYPATPKNTNLQTISNMRDLFACEVGLSDHTMGIGAAVAAVAIGATVIEKHFTLSRSDGGVDSAFSLEPNELASLVIETERAHQALGSISYGSTQAEKGSLSRRRSLYIGENMKSGEIFTSKNLRRVRPGNGLLPKYYELLLGKRVKFDVLKGTPVSWDMILDK